ncbi:MAG: hypothetical protein RMK15_03580 [Chloroflexota bacterium]|jgi:hypothetical protein|nr:hypothetical protein [Chloroflexota bacterium]
MAFVRLSLMTPKRGRAQEVERLLTELLTFQSQQDGYLAGYLLKPDPHQGNGRIGRVAVWRSEADANRVAALERDLALQSAIKLEVDEATHEEHSFEAVAFAPKG